MLGLCRAGILVLFLGIPMRPGHAGLLVILGSRGISESLLSSSSTGHMIFLARGGIFAPQGVWRNDGH